MIETLILPFTYSYMFNAMWVSSLVGAICAFLSVYLMLKGWSLIGDALSHSIVPGVAGAYMLGLPFALGAFVAGGLAAGVLVSKYFGWVLLALAVVGLITVLAIGLDTEIGGLINGVLQGVWGIVILVIGIIMINGDGD